MRAIERALEAARQPKQLAKGTPAQLPPGMLAVIKCAAGDQSQLDRLAQEMSTSEQKLRDAARIYLQHIITHADGSDRLVLGLLPGYSESDLREHKRWMLKWLHPDRNPSKWETKLFHRVKEAADRLESGKALEPASSKAAEIFASKKAVQRHASLRPGRMPTRSYKVKRLRKRDVLRMILVPVILAVCVALAAYGLWLRFGPTGGL